MTKLKKTIASLAACALMTSALALNVSAESFGVGVYDATATLSHTSTTATATTSLPVTGGTVSVTIVGTYYIKGTSKTTTASNGNGGTTATEASISNGGGDWVSLKSTHKGTYGTSTGSTTLKWPN